MSSCYASEYSILDPPEFPGLTTLDTVPTPYEVTFADSYNPDTQNPITYDFKIKIISGGTTEEFDRQLNIVCGLYSALLSESIDQKEY